jgi:uncharacterized membrane protein (UPF0127 family)
MENIFINHKGRRISVFVKRLSFFGKFMGLMFRTNETKNLLFEFPENTMTPIHSFFVFFPFLAVWLDSRNRIVEKRIVNPWILSVSPRKPFKRLIEIPLNDENSKILSTIL